MLMVGMLALITVFLSPPGQPFAFEGSAPGAWLATYQVQFTSAAVATHSTKGVVKSIDDNTLVITRSVRRGKEMTFVLDSTTRREGSVIVGTVVEVRYRTKASRRVAAVVSAQDSKRQR